MSYNSRFDRKVREVLEYIRVHPGCSTNDIDSTILGKLSVIESALYQLRMTNLIENREDPGVDPRWYPIEVPAAPEYLSLADEILLKMDTFPREERKAYLAKRLEELMGPV